MTILWCMVPEIQSGVDRIFCHSTLFFALLLPYGPRKSKFWKNEKNAWRHYHFTNVYHTCQSYDVSFLRYGVQQTEFSVTLHHFLPPYPKNLTTQKINILKKWKKRPGDITILHLCTINNNHTVYGSWDMKHDRQNFLPFWTIFCPFTPLTTWKIKISKNWEKHLEIYHFIHVYQKWWSYDVWFLSY